MSLLNRLKKNLKKHAKWSRKSNFDCWRLYDRDIPEYPYIIDLYGEYAVVWLRLEKIDYEEKRQGYIEELYSALDTLGFPENKRFIKQRKIQKVDEKYLKEAEENYTLVVKEGELSFEVNLSDYLDTGLFLDHRPWRQSFLERNFHEKRALNLFCYTGSLSVALAKANAQVTSVDLSPKYLQWAKRNFALNHLDERRHHWHEGDCLAYLRDLPTNSFDLIVIDPPSFSTSKKFRGSFDVQRDHPFLLKEALRIIKDNGEIYFSTNLRSFKIDPSFSQFIETSHKTIPSDFHDKKIHHSYFFHSKASE